MVLAFVRFGSELKPERYLPFVPLNFDSWNGFSLVNSRLHWNIEEGT